MPRTLNVHHGYISRNSKILGGEPIIKGTRFPVRSIVFYVIKEGMLPEELVKEFPQLTLSSVYDALSYYYDHRLEIEKSLKQQKEELWGCWSSSRKSGYKGCN